MRQLIFSPDKFAEWFNTVVPGAYRKIDAEDVRDMTDYGLIGRYQYYGRTDLETVRAILNYEQLRQNRNRRNEIRDDEGMIHCRRCGVVLPTKAQDKRGRPKEYCSDCEAFRARERYRKWREKRSTPKSESRIDRLQPMDNFVREDSTVI